MYQKPQASVLYCWILSASNAGKGKLLKLTVPRHTGPKNDLLLHASWLTKSLEGGRPLNASHRRCSVDGCSSTVSLVSTCVDTCDTRSATVAFDDHRRTVDKREGSRIPGKPRSQSTMTKMANRERFRVASRHGLET
jgi:hypothetical protein